MYKRQGLTYAISAGVIAILSISDTRRSTIKQAYQRFMSTLLALAIGSLAFSFFGFNLWALGVFIALYVPCAFLLGWQIGITPVSYTHLDVYKRQIYRCLKLFFDADKRDISIKMSH